MEKLFFEIYMKDKRHLRIFVTLSRDVFRPLWCVNDTITSSLVNFHNVIISWVSFSFFVILEWFFYRVFDQVLMEESYYLLNYLKSDELMMSFLIERCLIWVWSSIIYVIVDTYLIVSVLLAINWDCNILLSLFFVIIVRSYCFCIDYY